MPFDSALSHLDAAWLSRPATAVAPELLGCTLVRQFPDGSRYQGLIVETEAYEPDDPACHAYRRRTPRNEVMFGPPGACYVYLIYGVYHCLNVVTDLSGIPSAVLLRALQMETLPPWVDDNQLTQPHRVAAGPGKLCRLLKIDRSLNGTELTPEQPLWLAPRTEAFQTTIATEQTAIIQTTRIGLTQGADLPWRWYLANCPAVSKQG